MMKTLCGLGFVVQGFEGGGFVRDEAEVVRQAGGGEFAFGEKSNVAEDELSAVVAQEVLEEEQGRNAGGSNDLDEFEVEDDVAELA